MSNQQIGYVVGGVIGYFAPGVGFAVGAAIGGIAGALLTPKQKIEGPKLDDLKVTVSTYGGGITTLYGNGGIGGNVVWSTDKIEIPKTTSSGKGGGTENTSYDYFVHMGIVLCETPTDGSIVSIRKIWQDGKLIYDASSGMPIGSAIASAESPYSFIEMYQGHDDQLPDGIEEVYEGVGNVPTYRGVVRVRMNAVHCPGGRIPQFSFECCVDAGLITERTEFANFGSPMAGFAETEAVWSFEEAAGNAYKGTVLRGSAGQANSVQVPTLSSEPADPFDTYQPPYALVGAATPKAIYVFADYAGGSITRPINVYELDIQEGTSTLIYTQAAGNQFAIGAIGRGQRARAAYDQVTEAYVIKTDPPVDPTHLDIIKNGAIIATNSTDAHVHTPIAFYDGFVYVMDVGLTAAPLLPSIIKIDATTGLSVAQYDGSAPIVGLSLESSAIHASALGVAVYAAGTPSQLFLVNPDTGVWTLRAANASLVGGESGYQYATSSIHYQPGYALVGPSLTGKWTMLRLDVIEPEGALVADIISDQCVRSGMSAGQIDVSGIVDEVFGYVIANPASARTNIQPLLTAYAIYATEEDGKIKFKKMANLSSTASISYYELGAVEGDAEPGDQMPMMRTQEAELPRSVTVSVINPSFDYQTTSEPAQRQVTTSKMDQVVELPICTSSDHAATVAHQILYDTWNERERRAFKVSRKFACMSAGDVTTIEYPRGVSGDWRITKLTDTGALIEAECVPFDAGLWTQIASGSPVYVGQEVDALAPPARIQPLDIPILRDVDNNASLYIPMDGYGPGFDGGELFVGDDDTNLVTRGTVLTDAPIGFAETALGDWQRSVVDETNLFTISIGDDTFGSVTRDVLLSGGAEYWALGAPGRWEIGASALGDDLGDGRYILSRHLRGLFGTEQHAATHIDGDVFVLLRASGILRPSMGVGDIGQAKSYRPVSKGRSFDSANSITYTNTGEGLKPLSPVDLRRTNANDLTWDRRSRLSMNNLTGTLPLGEASERYTVEFYTAGFAALAASTVVISPTITSAQITALGLTPAATLYVRVYQMSDSVGQGRPLEATI